MNGGYIRLHRKVEFCEAIGMDWFLAGAWERILMKAAYKPTTYRGKPVQRGEFGYTFRELVSQWEKSHNTIRKVFEHFEKHGMIRRFDKSGVSFVVVVNYDAYQSDSVSPHDTRHPSTVSRDDTHKTPPVSPRDTIGDTLRDTQKKKEKKVKKERERAPAFVPPTLEEVRAYCLERSNGIDPQSWYDHYLANGWRVGRTAMRDWRASVRTWERREAEFRGNGHGGNGKAAPEYKLLLPPEPGVRKRD